MIPLAVVAAVALVVQAFVIVRLLDRLAAQDSLAARERHILASRIQAPTMVPLYPELDGAPAPTSEQPEEQPDEYAQVGVAGDNS